MEGKLFSLYWHIELVEISIEIFQYGEIKLIWLLIGNTYFIS